MRRYIRLYQGGRWYFFTVVTHQRQPILCTDTAIKRLRRAFKTTMLKRPFQLDAVVILPDHLHCIWVLPEGDKDFSLRWQLIKHDFSVGCGGAVWQPRFWEHLLRNELDWRRHKDYIYYNPVKHGLVKRPSDWPYSSFKKEVFLGFYETQWGSASIAGIADWNLE